jgi:hypothetical protein
LTGAVIVFGVGFCRLLFRSLTVAARMRFISHGRLEFDMRSRLYIAVVVALLTLGGLAPEALAIKIRLRNDLTVGMVTEYAVRIAGTRVTPGLRYEENVRFTQEGRLTLAVLEAPDRRHARRAWMMTLDPPQLVEITRDGQPVTQPPPAGALGLPPAASQLRLATIDAAQASASPVGGSRVQRAGLLLALDFSQWPNRLIAEGETWESPVERPELAGTWKHTYVSMTGRGRTRVARGRFEFSGALIGPFADVAEVKQVTGSWAWRVAERSLEASESQVMLAYGPKGERRELSMQVSLSRTQRRKLAADDLADARTELQQLGKLSNPVNPQPEALAEFVKTHPESLWSPVARDLLARTRINTEALGAMDADRLRNALVTLIRRWQRAALSGSVEALQPVRATFREMMAAQRTALHELAGDADQNTRAMATFCVAFGDQPADLTVVTRACADASERVRIWAAYGLAERRDPNTDLDVLLELLGDAHPKVRVRACQATRACVPIDSPRRGEFARRLLRMVTGDPDDLVHPPAAQALDALATEEELPALIEAEAQEEVPSARWQLEATIRRLGGKPKSASDN